MRTILCFMLLLFGVTSYAQDDFFYRSVIQKKQKESKITKLTGERVEFPDIVYDNGTCVKIFQKDSLSVAVFVSNDGRYKRDSEVMLRFIVINDKKTNVDFDPKFIRSYHYVEDSI